MKNKFIRKFLEFSYGSWIGLVVGFLSTILMTRLLSPEEFGKTSMFTLAISILMIISTLGTDQTFVRFYYEEKEDNRSGLFYNCLIPSIITLCIISIVILLFSKKISYFLFGEYNMIVVWMIILASFIQVLYRFATLVIRMKQRGSLFSIVEIVYRILSILTFIFFYMFFEHNYKILIYSTVSNFALITIFCISQEKEFWLNKKNKDLRHSRQEIILYGLPIVVNMMITFFFQSFDKIALKQWSTYEELGLYSAAMKIVALVTVVQTTFTTFWTPVAYEKYENDPEEKVFYSKVTSMVTIAMFTVGILSIMFKDIIVYLLGSEYVKASNIMPFLIFVPIMYTISETTVIGINFKKKQHLHIIIAMSVCILNIVCNSLLVPRFGALGASIATAFSYIIFLILRTLISYKNYKVDYKFYKILLMIVIELAYCFFAIINENQIYVFLVGIILIAFLISLYKKEIIGVLKINLKIKE